MIIEQKTWASNSGWSMKEKALSEAFKPQLTIVFGSRALLEKSAMQKEIFNQYPDSYFIGCSTSGEIADVSVLDESIVMTSIQFERTRIEKAIVKVESPAQSYNAAEELIRQLPPEGLKHVFVLSDGLNVNGTELVNGFRKSLPNDVHVTGGLAGDGAVFEQTFVLGGGNVSDRVISAIGFYGDSIQIGFGSFGGWDSFGLERVVTKSEGNKLYTIDDQPALELYKSFLGDQAKELPASGLLFPLSLRTKPDEAAVVRTILSVNEMEQSITFAGDLPVGSYVRLMKANIDRLIDGAVKAAGNINLSIRESKPDLGILISCVGRKLVLKQLVEEEVEGVRYVLGSSPVLTGFYSYGEISPFSETSLCELHNQTMTITTFKEI
jgi:hypothetical protein